MRAGLLPLAALLAGLAGAGPAVAGQVGPRVGYMLYCSGCHGIDGSGSPQGGIPSFIDGVGSFATDDRGRLYMANVPGVVGANVDAALTATILNYVVDTFAGRSRDPAARRFDGAEIAGLWARRPADVVGLRRDLVLAYSAVNRPVPGDYPWP